MQKEAKKVKKQEKKQNFSQMWKSRDREKYQGVSKCHSEMAKKAIERGIRMRDIQQTEGDVLSY